VVEILKSEFIVFINFLLCVLAVLHFTAEQGGKCELMAEATRRLAVECALVAGQ
jgi:hypothetical protein